MEVQIPQWEGVILREGKVTHLKYRDTLQQAVLKQLNRSRCHSGWGSDPPAGRENFKWKGVASCKAYQVSAASCAKTAELIEMMFGISTRVGPPEWAHFLGSIRWSAHRRHLQNTTKQSMCRGHVKLLQPLVLRNVLICVIWPQKCCRGTSYILTGVAKTINLDRSIA